jgi:hypothetical protein
VPKERTPAEIKAEASSEETKQFVRRVRRVTRRKFGPEEKVRVVLGIDAIEAAVVPLDLPGFVLTGMLSAYLYHSVSRLRGVELFTFTGASVLVALGLLLGWGIYHGGWPEPSELGLT